MFRVSRDTAESRKSSCGIEFLQAVGPTTAKALVILHYLAPNDSTSAFSDTVNCGTGDDAWQIVDAGDQELQIRAHSSRRPLVGHQTIASPRYCTLTNHTSPITCQLPTAKLSLTCRAFIKTTRKLCYRKDYRAMRAI